MINAGLVQGNRDPRKFERPDEFVLDRPNIKDHLGFGWGPHRCPGSHLATAELITVINEWHRRIPDYRIVASEQITERGGQIRLQYLPMEWH